jgi:hypothetical protein
LGGGIGRDRGVKDPWNMEIEKNLVEEEDNCDLQSEHLTIEVVEKETVDTSNLSTEKRQSSHENEEETMDVVVGEEEA